MDVKHHVCLPTYQLSRGKRFKFASVLPFVLLVQSFHPSFFHGALRPQKPYGLLGVGEEWDRNRPTSLFTQLLRSESAKLTEVQIRFGLISVQLVQSCDLWTLSSASGYYYTYTINQLQPDSDQGQTGGT